MAKILKTKGAATNKSDRDRERKVISTSKQLNYLYNLEGKSISAFSQLARMFHSSSGSFASKTRISGTPTEVDTVIVIDSERTIGRKDRSRRIGHQSPSSLARAKRLRESLTGLSAKKTANKPSVKKASAKKAAPKKVVKKAAPKKAAKKAAPKKATKKAAKKG